MNDAFTEIAPDAAAVDHIGHQVVKLPGSGRHFGIAACPDRGGDADHKVQAVVAALQRLDKLEVEASNDRKLSEYGREQLLAPERAKTVQAVGEAWQTIDDVEQFFAEREAQLYAVPQIPPTDGATYSEDKEIRDYARSLQGEERSQFIRSLGDPEHARTLLALRRSPVNIGILQNAARDLWTQHINMTRASEVATVQAGKAGVSWARAQLVQMGRLATEMAKYERKDIIRVLRHGSELDKGAHRVFAIADADWKSAALAAERGGRS